MWKAFGALAVLKCIVELHGKDLTMCTFQNVKERVISLILLPEEDADDLFSPSLIERAVDECFSPVHSVDVDGMYSCAYKKGTFWHLCDDILVNMVPMRVEEGEHTSALYDRAVSIILGSLVPRYYYYYYVSAASTSSGENEDDDDDGGEDNRSSTGRNSSEGILSASTAATWRFLTREIYLPFVDGACMYSKHEKMMRFTSGRDVLGRSACGSEGAYGCRADTHSLQLVPA